MTLTTDVLQLTDEQVAFYHREGYLTLPAISTPEEIAWLTGIYDRLFQTQAGRENGDQFDLAGTDEDGKPAALPQILNPLRYAPELKESRYRINATAIARQLLGPESAYVGEHMIFKPPFVGAPTPWHQDEAYHPGEYIQEKLQFWMPLQPATVENGCMQFIPRSHLMPLQPHQQIGNDPRIHGLEAVHVDDRSAVACPLEAGGCTIHHVRMFHYAGPNRSATPRRAYILGYATPAKRREVPIDDYWNKHKKTALLERRARAAEAAEAAEAGKSSTT